MQELPKFVFIEILNYLGKFDIGSLAQCCKRFKRIIRTKEAWYTIAKKFPLIESYDEIAEKRNKIYDLRNPKNKFKNIMVQTYFGSFLIRPDLLAGCVNTGHNANICRCSRCFLTSYFEQNRDDLPNLLKKNLSAETPADLGLLFISFVIGCVLGTIINSVSKKSI